jgi:aminopeptidase N
VFPCFDQPDLKAQITFNCIGQVAKWKILSNEAPIHTSPFVAADYKAKAIPTYNPKHDALLDQFIADQKGTFYIFPQTKLLPTYLYCLIVGDYYELNVKPEEQFKVIYSLFRIFP